MPSYHRNSLSCCATGNPLQTIPEISGKSVSPTPQLYCIGADSSTWPSFNQVTVSYDASKDEKVDALNVYAEISYSIWRSLQHKVSYCTGTARRELANLQDQHMLAELDA